MISYFRHGWPIGSAAGPEIAIAILAAAMALYGISLIVLFLIAAMVLVRSFWIAVKLRTWLVANTGPGSEAKLPAKDEPPPATLDPP